MYIRSGLGFGFHCRHIKQLQKEISHILRLSVRWWRICFFYAILCLEIIGIRHQITTEIFNSVMYHIYRYKKRTDVINISSYLYIFLKKPKIFWRKKYIPPGTNTHTTYFIENRKGIPMSSCCIGDTGTFLCGFLIVWIKSYGARGPP